jgi:hypothetical protein
VADEDRWLPPRAPGAGPPPRYVPGEPEEAPTAARPAPAAAAPAAAPARPPRAAGPASRDIPATAAMVLAILSLGLLVFSIGVGFWLTLPLSGLSWYLGKRARERVDAGEGRTGRSQAQAGYVLGVAGVVLGTIAAVGWIVSIAVLGYDPQDLQRDLQHQLDRNAGQALILAARVHLGR